jgi:hypothetical protein
MFLFYVVPASERKRQMALATQYLQQLKQLTQTEPCSLCNAWYPQKGMFATSIKNLELTEISEGHTEPTFQELSTPLANTDTSSAEGRKGCVCVQCLAHLRSCRVPDFSLTGKRTLPEMPPELGNLTLLERLLVTKRFHVVHWVTVLPAREGSRGYYLDARLFPDREHFYYTNTLPVAADQLHCLLKVTFLHDAQEGHELLRGLVVRRQTVVQALRWLQANNVFYTDCVVDEMLLNSLPIEGIPADWSRVVLARSGQYKLILNEPYHSLGISSKFVRPYKK